MVLAAVAIRGFEQTGSVGELARARRERARIELYFGRPDLARATLTAAASRGSELHACLVALMLLQCDLQEAFETVEEARVVHLLERSKARGARERAMSEALHAWWLAGNGADEAAGAALSRARVLDPACGMQQEEINRISRIVESPSHARRPRDWA